MDAVDWEYDTVYSEKHRSKAFIVQIDWKSDRVCSLFISW